MNMMDIKNKLDACSSVEEIRECKKDTLSVMEIEHRKKMLAIENMKARHEAENDELAKLINNALNSGDFEKVQSLLKKQAELIKQHGAEMLSIM